MKRIARAAPATMRQKTILASKVCSGPLCACTQNIAMSVWTIEFVLCFMWTPRRYGYKAALVLQERLFRRFCSGMRARSCLLFCASPLSVHVCRTTRLRVLQDRSRRLKLVVHFTNS